MFNTDINTLVSESNCSDADSFNNWVKVNRPSVQLDAEEISKFFLNRMSEQLISKKIEIPESTQITINVTSESTVNKTITNSNTFFKNETPKREKRLFFDFYDEILSSFLKIDPEFYQKNYPLIDCVAKHFSNKDIKQEDFKKEFLLSIQEKANACKDNKAKATFLMNATFIRATLEKSGYIIEIPFSEDEFFHFGSMEEIIDALIKVDSLYSEIMVTTKRIAEHLAFKKIIKPELKSELALILCGSRNKVNCSGEDYAFYMMTGVSLGAIVHDLNKCILKWSKES